MMLKFAGCIATALLCACLPARAQTYPAREIRVVVGLPAGSGGDIVARYYADKLSQLSGKPVIVENRPGMILSIGADTVAKAPPDGYTILITSVSSSHAANVFNFKKLPYDPIKDFTPVATLQKSYFILMTRADAPWKTVAELTEAMKPFVPHHNALLMANHGAVAYGESIERAFWRMETLEHFAKINLVAKMLGRENQLSAAEVHLMRLRTVASRKASTNASSAAGMFISPNDGVNHGRHCIKHSSKLPVVDHCRC